MLSLRYISRFFFRSQKTFLLSGGAVFFSAAVFVFSVQLIAGAQQFVSQKSQELIGGDIRMSSNFPIDYSELPLLDELQKNGAEIIEVSTLNAMVQSDTSELLVRMKIVPQEYPLYGKVEMELGNSYSFPSEDGIYIDNETFSRLDIEVGDMVQVGLESFRILGSVESEPDLGNGFFSFGGKGIISSEGFERTQIDRTSSRVQYVLLIQVAENTLVQPIVDRLKKEIAEKSIRVTTANSQEGGGVLEGLEQIQKFLMTMVIMVLLLTLVAIYMSVTVFLEEKEKTIAVYRAFGAKRTLLVSIFFGVILFWTGFFGLLGSVLGAYCSGFAAELASTSFGIPLQAGFSVKAVSLGLLMALGFGCIGAAQNITRFLSISPLSLLRTRNVRQQKKQQKIEGLLTVFVLFVGIFLLSLALIGSLQLALIIAAGFSFALLVSAGFVKIFFFALGHMRHFFASWYIMRTTLSFFRRPGGGSIFSLAALMLAFFAVQTVWILGATFLSSIRIDLNAESPSMIVLDVQKDQLDLFRSISPETDLRPVVRARITQIDDRTIERNTEQENEDGETRRTFNISYADVLDADEEVIQGALWDIGANVAEVSVEEGYAERFQIEMGSVLTFDIQGVPLSATVTSIRRFDTTRFDPWFAFLFPEKVLQDAPTTFFGFSRIAPENIPELQKKLVTTFPNISVVTTEDVVKKIVPTLQAIVATIRFFAGIMVGIGFLVLLSMLMASSRRRVKDFFVFRIFGAQRNWLNKAYLAEVFLSVASAWIIGFFLSLVVSYIVAKKVFQFDEIVLDFIPLVIGILVMIFGFLIGRRFLGKI